MLSHHNAPLALVIVAIACASSASAQPAADAVDVDMGDTLAEQLAWFCDVHATHVKDRSQPLSIRMAAAQDVIEPVVEGTPLDAGSRPPSAERNGPQVTGTAGRSRIIPTISETQAMMTPNGALLARRGGAEYSTYSATSQRSQGGLGKSGRLPDH